MQRERSSEPYLLGANSESLLRTCCSQDEGPMMFLPPHTPHARKEREAPLFLIISVLSTPGRLNAAEDGGDEGKGGYVLSSIDVAGAVLTEGEGINDRGDIVGVCKSSDGVWLANSQSCCQGARTNSRAVTRVGTAEGPNPRCACHAGSTTDGAHSTARSVDTHRDLCSCLGACDAHTPSRAIGV